MQKEEKIFHGIVASPGIVIGKAYLYTKKNPRVEEKKVVAEEIPKELERLHHAIERSEKELQKIMLFAEQKIGETKIFEAQILILQDTVLLDSITKRISKECKNAEYIVYEEFGKYQQLLFNAQDEYMRERANDIEDIKNRIIRNIQQEKLISRFEENSIVIAQSLTPADTILFSRNNVLGYVTEMGGTTSHASLLSRSLQLPSIVGVKNITEHIETGDDIIVDGLNGNVILNPTEKTKKKSQKKYDSYITFENELGSLRELYPTTLDGKTVTLSSNIESTQEIDFTFSQGSQGVGLFRSERLLLERSSFPTEEEQYQVYKEIAHRMFPQRVVLRTFDIGGDKNVFQTQTQLEENPFLGWRGIRLLLDKPEILLSQLQAMLRASEKGNATILFPMVSGLQEVQKIKSYLKEAKKNLQEKNIPFDNKISIGIMIEVPSAAMLIDTLAQEVDYISIGTNDLIQYLLAVDRGNERVSSLYQEFHPAVIQTIHTIITTTHRHKKKVGMCGDMASNPLATTLLLGLGLDEFSVIPALLPEIKKVIRSVDFQQAKELAVKVLALSSEEEIKKILKKHLHTILPDMPIMD